MSEKVKEMLQAMADVLATSDVESIKDVMELLAESSCRLLCALAQAQGLQKEDFHDVIKCYGTGIMTAEFEF